MTVSRTRLAWIIEKSQEEAKKSGKELSPEALAEKIADYVEANPSCVNPYERAETRKRFSYSTVGYGVFTLLGEKYRLGRIEIFDDEANSSYQIDEGTYCMPHEEAAAFEDFIEALQTDLPIQIEMGTVETCEKACAESLGLSSKEDLRNPKILEEFYKAHNDKHAQDEGFADYEAFVAHIQSEKKP